MTILTVDYTSPNAQSEFAKSVHDSGFAIVTNHGIPFELIDKVREEWATFYNQPTEEKMKYIYKDEACQNGYFPFKVEYAKGETAPNLMEFFHYYPWVDAPEFLHESTLELYNLLKDRGNTLISWLNDALPDETKAKLVESLPEMMRDSESCLFRPIHYPPLEGEDQQGSVRSAAHADICMLTILVAASAPGLQVQDKDGSWVAVECDPHQLICNVGDMMDMATGGYYKSTIHRVVNPVGELAHKPRYSMPMFLHPRNEVQLSDTHTAASYMRERFTEQKLTRD